MTQYSYSEQVTMEKFKTQNSTKKSKNKGRNQLKCKKFVCLFIYLYKFGDLLSGWYTYKQYGNKWMFITGRKNY